MVVSLGMSSFSGRGCVCFSIVEEGELAGWVGAEQVSSRKLVEVAG